MGFRTARYKACEERPDEGEIIR